MANRLDKMIDLLLAEENTDNSSSADMLREMVDTAGRQIADIYGDRDIRTPADRADFLNVLDHFISTMWIAVVPLVVDEPGRYQEYMDRFVKSTTIRTRLTPNRTEVLEFYARSTRTMN